MGAQVFSVMMLDDELVAAAMAEAEEAAATEEAAKAHMDAASAAALVSGSATVLRPNLPPQRAELAERQLAALMEMGYHAAHVAPFCDGKTPLEFVVEQIACSAGEAPPSDAGTGTNAPAASPTSTASQGGKNRGTSTGTGKPYWHSAAVGRLHILRLQGGLQGGLRHAAQKAWRLRPVSSTVRFLPPSSY